MSLLYEYGEQPLTDFPRIEIQLFYGPFGKEGSWYKLEDIVYALGDDITPLPNEPAMEPVDPKLKTWFSALDIKTELDLCGITEGCDFSAYNMRPYREDRQVLDLWEPNQQWEVSDGCEGWHDLDFQTTTKYLLPWTVRPKQQHPDLFEIWNSNRPITMEKINET